MQLELIRTDGGTQPRETYHYGCVDTYAEDMEAGAIFPPVIVFYDGTDYWLADGFHRVLASKKIGRSEIEADVRQGTLQDAQWYSYGVNRDHGLQRKNEDKRRAVEAALRHPYHAGLSDQQIADHCGVSRVYVNQISNSLVNVNKSNRTTTRTGKDGRITNTSTIGKKKQSPTPKPESEDDEPLTPYEQQIASQYEAAHPIISEPPHVSDDVLNQEVDRLITQYGYADYCRLIELMSERIAVEA